MSVEAPDAMAPALMGAPAGTSILEGVAGATQLAAPPSVVSPVHAPALPPGEVSAAGQDVPEVDMAAKKEEKAGVEETAQPTGTGTEEAEEEPEVAKAQDEAAAVARPTTLTAPVTTTPPPEVPPPPPKEDHHPPETPGEEEPADENEDPDIVAESEGERKRRRRGWTDEEEKRLREGVAQHGAGQWAKIRDSYGFKSENDGEGRSCVNLKDKWRNLNRSPRPEKPRKPPSDQPKRPPRKKKPRTPKRKRADGENAEDETPQEQPTVWIPQAAAWCRSSLQRVEKGKVHVGTLRQHFSLSADFPTSALWGGDEAEVENLKYDLENPKTEASKKFRAEALEPFVGEGAIRQNCFINGLNQLGVFGWSLKGEEPAPRARAVLHVNDADADVDGDAKAEGTAPPSLEAMPAASSQVVDAAKIVPPVPAALGAGDRPSESNSKDHKPDLAAQGQPIVSQLIPSTTVEVAAPQGGAVQAYV